MDEITTTAKQENETQEQPPLKIQIGNQNFVAIKYWRENNDFIFITDNNEQYHCTNTYPIAMKFDGIDCSSTEELTITGSIIQYNNADHSNGQRNQMMNKLQRLQKEAEQNEMVLEITPAPEKSLTFDIMLILRRKSEFILEVIFYDSQTDKIIKQVG